MNPLLFQCQVYFHRVQDYARACFGWEAEQGSEPPKPDLSAFPEPPMFDLSVFPDWAKYSEQMDLELERYRWELECARLEMEMALARARLDWFQWQLARQPEHLAEL